MLLNSLLFAIAPILRALGCCFNELALLLSIANETFFEIFLCELKTSIGSLVMVFFVIGIFFERLDDAKFRFEPFSIIMS